MFLECRSLGNGWKPRPPRAWPYHPQSGEELCESCSPHSPFSLCFPRFPSLKTGCMGPLSKHRMKTNKQMITPRH